MASYCPYDGQRLYVSVANKRFVAYQPCKDCDTMWREEASGNFKVDAHGVPLAARKPDRGRGVKEATR
jgi:hypothetical protein